MSRARVSPPPTTPPAKAFESPYAVVSGKKKHRRAHRFRIDLRWCDYRYHAPNTTNRSCAHREPPAILVPVLLGIIPFSSLRAEKVTHAQCPGVIMLYTAKELIKKPKCGLDVAHPEAAIIDPSIAYRSKLAPPIYRIFCSAAN